MKPPPRWPAPVRLGLLGAGYGLLSIASVTLTRFDGGAAFIWLASAPLLVALLSRPFRSWPGPLICCAIGSCLSTSLFGLGAWAALPLAAVLISEGVFAAVLLRWTGTAHSPLDTVESFGRFVAVLGVVVPAVTAGPAASIICMTNGQPLRSAAVPWFAAHSLGFLTLTPLLLLVRERTAVREFQSLIAKARVRGLALLVASLAVYVGTFSQSGLTLLFLPFLPLTLTAFLMGRLGAAAALVMLAMVGSGFTLVGLGPLALMSGTVGAKAQFFQFYMAVAVMMVLPIAAELRRRESTFLRLQESEAGMRLLTEHVGDVILHTDADGVVRYASSSLERVAGMTPAAICQCLADDAPGVSGIRPSARRRIHSGR